MNYDLYQGDAIEVMRTLPSNSVQCCITSPPYFGLRDYQTATWEGGDAGCDHAESYTHVSDKSTLYSPGEIQPSAAARKHGEQIGKQYRDTCGKCGARRIDQQIGLESTPESYIAKLVEVFREVRRLLHPTGVCWVNIGDSFSDKQLLGIPWRVAFALQADAWILRAEIIWHKRAPMPESCRDRPTKAHEQVFLLTKQATYYYDSEAIREPQTEESIERWGNGGQRQAGPKAAYRTGKPTEPFAGVGLLPNGRNRRSVWTLGPENFAGAHFATMPTKLVEPCILAGTSAHGCCAKCGAPWERIVERTKYEPQEVALGVRNVDDSRGDRTRKLNGKSAEWRESAASSVTLGWQPTCLCQADVIPCTVLDPFSGSGTVVAVALKHGRNAIGIDLSAAYNEMAHRRIAETQPLLLAAD